MKRTFYALPLAALLAACASGSASRYMAADEPGDFGYYESRLEHDRYRIAYKSRGDNAEVSKDYALLRAAELTLEHGYDWFEVVDRDTNTREGRSHTRVHSTMMVYGTSYRECGVLTCRTVVHPPYVGPSYLETEHRGPESTVTFVEIHMGAGRMPDEGGVYDARTLASTIRARS